MRSWSLAWHVLVLAPATALALSRRSAPETVVSECRLIEGFFAYVVQLLLGVVAVTGLFVKRQCFERPKRPFGIWALDAMKQAMAAAFAHVFNIMLAMFLAEADLDKSHAPDQCAWYCINYLVDTVFGVMLAWVYLRILDKLADSFSWDSQKESGNYGEPPSYSRWAKQTFAWVMICFYIKCTLLLVMLPFVRQLGRLGSWMFKPLRHDPELELLVVMVLVPCVLNLLQFWIFDNFLMQSPDHLKLEDTPDGQRKDGSPRTEEADSEYGLVGDAEQDAAPQRASRDDLAEAATEHDTLLQGEDSVEVPPAQLGADPGRSSPH